MKSRRAGNESACSLAAPKAEADISVVQDRGRCYGLTFRGTPMIENAQLMHL
jgi:hypothetical protein